MFPQIFGGGLLRVTGTLPQQFRFEDPLDTRKAHPFLGGLLLGGGGIWMLPSNYTVTLSVPGITSWMQPMNPTTLGVRPSVVGIVVGIWPRGSAIWEWCWCRMCRMN